MEVSFIVIKTNEGKYRVVENIMLKQTHEKILESLHNDDPVFSDFNDLKSAGEYLATLSENENQ